MFIIIIIVSLLVGQESQKPKGLSAEVPGGYVRGREVVKNG